MYGLVNRAIEDMAIQAGGYEIWEAIKLKAGVDVATFISMQTYPDEVTYKLVDSASQILGVPANELLRQFGKHWILFTAKEGYGDLLKTSGTNIREFLGNLDTMHSRIASTMTDLKPPSFECIDINDKKLQVLYYSDRQGLAPMVVGLLEGLGEMFNVDVKVTHQNTNVEKGYDTFELEYI
ncbi:MAG: heme NO-binding domain-containing protein [Colwellia sp.]|nr:heme NO-binding domain-containing protein [Colwellia sp.]